MKRFALLFIAAVATLAIASAQPKELAGAKKADVQVLKTIIKVPTIVCNSCVRTITEALKKVDGVKTAKIDLKRKIATVTYAAATVTVDKLEKAIASAGYDANNVKRNAEAYDKLDDCCKVDRKK